MGSPSARKRLLLPNSLSQSDSARQIFLDFHNDVRRNIALGKGLLNWTVEADAVILGPAQNMYKVDWDCELEQKAAKQLACTVPLPVDPNLASNIAQWLYYKNSEEEKVTESSIVVLGERIAGIYEGHET
ncbi:SCP-like protein [Ostertagia ostertagi]